MANEVIVAEIDDGQRLDRWIKKYYPHITFGQAQKIVRTGQMRVNGKRVKNDTRLEKGQSVRIPPQMGDAEAAPLQKKVISEKDTQFMTSMVIYEDEHLIALNKPQGLAVQGGSKVKKHVDGLLDALAQKGIRPHLVHRLDKETSGVLLLARHPKAAKLMGELFSGRDIRKYYWAIVSPVPKLEEGKIKSSIAKVASGGGERMMAVSDDDSEGKMALSYYKVIEAVGKAVAWVAFWPRTGRTHQLRVHAAEMGTPIIGDDKYNYDNEFLQENPELSDTLHLHARRVIFRHPMTGKKVDITAPLGAEMKKTFKHFGFDANDKSDPFTDVE